MKVFIVNKKSISIKEYIEILKKYDIEIEKNYYKSDFILLLGGDGTTLKLVKYCIFKNLPILAINFGKLGFLASIMPNEFEFYIKKFLNKEYTLSKKRLLEVKVENKLFYALNEMCILKSNNMAKIVDICVYEQNKFVNRYRTDGLILATPTGSTAYSMSAGGPILSEDTNAVVLTAIAPQNISAIPIVLSGTKELTFYINKGSRDASLYIDGNIRINLRKEQKIVSKLSNKCLDFINFSNMDYYDILRKKLKWGENIVD